MSSDVGVHPQPVVALEKSFFSFVDAIVPDKLVAMGIYKSLLFQQGWEKNDNVAGFKLLFYVVPNNVIFYEAIICIKLNYLLIWGHEAILC